ncbi:MAG: DUF2029 domain-containing protein [Bacteroidetes bacterium]|nr:MAG: DUF2029 domain-containing protein [Bacteroidota bacterium]REK04778.1 MAG: DUF2029 domain-containing protein [Bacteroidota bacterium]REK36252.1 MAG: DUF2029 domain-containing protein [Bacteroidota bacterium]REK51086.1 MAG: DUF2029 domain-containing protein [Bacteroidota bacterium]
MNTAVTHRLLKIACILVFSILCLIHVIKGIIPAWKGITSDFPNYYVSSKLVLENNVNLNLYDRIWFQKKMRESGLDQEGKFSPFPPATVLLLLPVAGLDPLSAMRIMLIINIIAGMLCVILIKRIADLSLFQAAFLILLSGASLDNNLVLGQVYLLLLLSTLWIYLLIQRRKEFQAAIITGLGISIKYFPAIFVAASLLIKKIRFFFLTIAAVTAINLICVSLIGVQTYQDFFREVILKHFAGELEGQSPWAYAFQSWNSLGHRLFLFHPAENPSPLLQSNTAFKIFKTFTHVCIIAVSSIYLYKIRLKKNFFGLSVVILTYTVLLLSPAGATYHHLLAWLPYAILLSHRKPMQSKSKTLLMLILAVMIISSFAPYVISRMDIFTENLVISYYRLWSNLIIYSSSIFIIHFELNSEPEEITLQLKK